MRIIGVAATAAVLTYLVFGSLNGPLPWYAHGQLVIYSGFTIVLGWLTPREIDRWRASQPL